MTDIGAPVPDPFPHAHDDRPASADLGQNAPPAADGFGLQGEDPDLIIENPREEDLEKEEQIASSFLARLRANPLLTVGRFVRRGLLRDHATAPRRQSSSNS